MIKRIALILILLSAIIAAGYTTFNRPAVNCMMAEFIYMHEADDNIYISPDATEKEIQQSLALVREAKKRNTELWGDILSNPVFIFCTGWEDYYKFGMYRTQAMTRMNFAGEYIILSPLGMNPDDVSHEMCHAELYSRVGFENDKNIPLWFHEGLAMLVCKEYPGNYKGYLAEWNKMTKSSPDIIPLERISSDEDFYSSPSRSNLAYWRSGMEVSRWFAKSKRKGVLSLLDELKKGYEFNNAYVKAEGGN